MVLAHRALVEIRGIGDRPQAHGPVLGSETGEETALLGTEAILIDPRCPSERRAISGETSLAPLAWARIRAARETAE